MEYKCTLSSAIGYARNGKLEEWIHTYLQTDGHNKEFSDELQKVISENADMPPLIIHYVDGEFELNDGNHRLEAYARLGVEEYSVIVWITEKEEYTEFMEKYSKYME